jgi:DNA-binding transcriptional MerR regulator
MDGYWLLVGVVIHFLLTCLELHTLEFAQVEGNVSRTMEKRKLTIGALAKSSGLSRSTLLYYDRLGLLRPRGRSAANYRLYSPAETQRLEQICLHRQIGIPLKEIGRLLLDPGSNTSVEILQKRLQTLDRHISELRRQQRSIVQILKQESFRQEANVINKQRWVEIMRAAGLSEQDMTNWHAQFEKMEPAAHQEFLESLGIEPSEIKKIREHSRKQREFLSC